MAMGSMKFDTLCLHGGHAPDPTTLARAVPIYRTSSYVFRDTEHAANLFGLKELGNIYTRLMNPTTDVLEKRVALLEGAPEMGGLGVASGTAGVFNSIINVASVGDNIVSARNLYGGTFTQFHDILPTLGITVKLVDSTNPENFAAEIDDKTRAVFCETVSNPALEVTDLETVAAIAHGAGLPLIVDSTFSTPYLTRPLEFGADIVVHSLTKWFGGHGNGIGGVVIDSGRFAWGAGKHPLFDTPDTSYGGLRWGHDLPEPLAPLAFILRMRTVSLRNLGACIAPDNSWQFLQGIETLPLRMERHCENARRVALHLKEKPHVEWVRFPGLESDPEYARNQKYLHGKGGSMVVFGISGGKEAGSQHAHGFNPDIPCVGSLWNEECQHGWWDAFIGPGLAIDTEKFFVICANYLGGCYGSTGPRSIDPRSGSPYGSQFPSVRVEDLVDSQVRLLDHLGIEVLRAAIGASIGGMMALSLATLYPSRCRIVIPIGSGMEVTVLQRIINFEQARAIESDPNFRGGDYYDAAPPDSGLALARMIAHKTFVSLEVLDERSRGDGIRKFPGGGWFRIQDPIESYMMHQGRKFVGRFDANSYLRILEAWQRFDLLTPCGAANPVELFSRCRGQNYLLFTIDSDVAFYPQEQELLASALRAAGVEQMRITVHSLKGHDSFLLEPEFYKPHIAHALDAW
jgi:O-acetylhomoserine (thiol)-lyase